MKASDLPKHVLERLGISTRRRNKYGVASKAERTFDGIVFHSKREMHRYQMLCIARDAGACRFERQVAYKLPGRTKWFADFVVEWLDEYGNVMTTTVEDSKGIRTPVYRLKKRQIEEIYGIKIEEV